MVCFLTFILLDIIVRNMVGSSTTLMNHECSGVPCTASIPSQIGKLSKLTHLRLQENELSGELASEKALRPPLFARESILEGYSFGFIFSHMTLKGQYTFVSCCRCIQQFSDKIRCCR